MIKKSEFKFDRTRSRYQTVRSQQKAVESCTTHSKTKINLHIRDLPYNDLSFVQTKQITKKSEFTSDQTRSRYQTVGSQ